MASFAVPSGSHLLGAQQPVGSIASGLASLSEICGEWEYDNRSCTIESTGRALFEGKWKGKAYDLVETVVAGTNRISRGDGWEIDLKASSKDKLKWFKSGRDPIFWRRKQANSGQQEWQIVEPSLGGSQEQWQVVQQANVQAAPNSKFVGMQQQMPWSATGMPQQANVQAAPNSKFAGMQQQMPWSATGMPQQANVQAAPHSAFAIIQQQMLGSGTGMPQQASVQAAPNSTFASIQQQMPWSATGMPQQANVQAAPNSTFANIQQQMPWSATGMNAFLEPVRSGMNACGSPSKLFASEQSLEDKLVGVVVTLYQDSSYDAMFREVKPTAAPGERVSVYSLSCSAVGKLNEYLSSTSPVPAGEPSWQGLVDDVCAVPADTVVFNFECCSACGDQGFPRCQAMPRASIEFIGFAIRSGWTVMCSDFSLKALLADWSEEELGPNPFLRIGSFNFGHFCLEFEPSDLQGDDVPQQLKVVGELCSEQGKANVQAMGNTIFYTVNPGRPSTDKYTLKVLTVVTSQQVRNEVRCSVGEGSSLKHGAAGHVILTYPEGGQLVTSMGHWIELTRINTSLESVLRVAEQNFGAEEAARFSAGYAAQASAVDQYNWIQSNACMYVQQSVPAKGLQMQYRSSNLA